MRILDIGGIPTSLGEIMNIKYHLDLVKDQYDEIKLSFHRELWEGCLHTEASDWEQKRTLWNKYLNDIGQLFFSEPPYIVEEKSNHYGGYIDLILNKINVLPHKTELAYLLCKGVTLNLDSEYIVITTKVRHVDKKILLPMINELWSVLQNLSKKYKIVILGERIVEMRKEYNMDPNGIYGIYEDIISNLPKDRIVDLTVPALGETVSDFSQIQQDCLIMKEAKFVITIGVGGNFCMATSVADMTIGFRADSLAYTDKIFYKEYPNAIITKNWAHFINTLNRYI